MGDAGSPNRRVTDGRGSPAARSLAIRILRWYPKPWRVRYGSEMRALVAEMPVAWRQVADLAIGAARAWVTPRAFGWPARSAAGRIQVVRAYKFAFVTAAFESAIHASVAPGTFSGAWSDGLRLAHTAVLLAITARLVPGFLVSLPKWSWLIRPGWLRPVGSVEVACWFVAIAVWMVDAHNQPVPAWVDAHALHIIAEHLSPFIYVHLLFMNTARSRRLERAKASHLKRLLRQRA